ncbi:MAG: ATP-binding protein [Prolixibacteraceae bacterium]
MIQLDLRTVYLSYVLTDLVSLIVILSFYLQTSKRFPAIKYIVYSFLLHTMGTLLIFLRGSISDWFSIPLAHTFSVSAGLLLLIGLEDFLKKRSSQLHNYIYIAIFFIVHSYFSFVKPNIEYRSLNVSVAYFILFSQLAWLMVIRIKSNPIKFTYGVGSVFIIYALIHLYRIIDFFNHDHIDFNYFNSSNQESYFIFLNQVLFLFLTFTLVLMFNKRLLLDIGAQEQKFNKAFHASPNAITLTRLSDGKVFEVNQGFKKITGYEASEVIDKSSVDLNLWYNDGDRGEMLKELNEKSKLINREYLFRKKSGEIITGIFSAEILTINNEECIISTINDLSKQKKLEENLKSINATKDKFYSIIAHDLKAPFNTLIGLSEVLKNDTKELDTATIIHYANHINDTANQTYRLLENLLEWARMQQNTITFNPGSFKLKKIMEEVLELLQDKANQKEITIVSLVDEKVLVYADENMLKTVLRNLISNGLKFTRAMGKVEIRVEETENQTIIQVKDTGIGMDPEILANLFSLESNTTTPGTCNETGTGLGLLICKEFIQKHNGEIRVESKIGKGSIFSFSLPNTNRSPT